MNSIIECKTLEPSKISNLEVAKIVFEKIVKNSNCAYDMFDNISNLSVVNTYVLYARCRVIASFEYTGTEYQNVEVPFTDYRTEERFINGRYLGERKVPFTNSYITQQGFPISGYFDVPAERFEIYPSIKISTGISEILKLIYKKENGFDSPVTNEQDKIIGSTDKFDMLEKKTYDDIKVNAKKWIENTYKNCQASWRGTDDKSAISIILIPCKTIIYTSKNKSFSSRALYNNKMKETILEFPTWDIYDENEFAKKDKEENSELSKLFENNELNCKALIEKDKKIRELELELNRKNEEIQTLNNKKYNLSFFAFKEKKEVEGEIVDVENSIEKINNELNIIKEERETTKEKQEMIEEKLRIYGDDKYKRMIKHKEESYNKFVSSLKEENIKCYGNF